MKDRYLGKTGLKVSELCLGTMTFGGEISEDVCLKILDRFSDYGGYFIDTADFYSHGLAEEIIGRWLKRRIRDDFVIATKIGLPMSAKPNAAGLSRKHIPEAVEGCLRRLRTGYIDLLLIHIWDSHSPLDETLSIFTDLVRKGQVRYIGVSNLTGWQLQKSIDRSRTMGWEPIICLQARYNLLCRSTEWELLPVCEIEGLGMVAYSPLQEGWLSGKYRPEMLRPPSETRAASEWSDSSWDRMNYPHTWQVLKVLTTVANEVVKTPAQVALRWLLEKQVVTAPIIGVRTPEQLDDNLGACSWTLADHQMTQLDDASVVPIPYPYSYISRYQVAPWR